MKTTTELAKDTMLPNLYFGVFKENIAKKSFHRCRFVSCEITYQIAGNKISQLKKCNYPIKKLLAFISQFQTFARCKS
jgi:hypothetical protein